MSRDPRLTPYPGREPMRLPDGAACASPLHREHRDWWDGAHLHTSDGLAQARAAAAVCVTECAVLGACHAMAHDVRPTTGIYAAEAWIAGRGSKGQIAGRSLL